MALSDYLENAYLNWYRGTAVPAAPATTYFALFTADPTDAGTGAEVATTTGYAREALASTIWTAPADDGAGLLTIQNNADFDMNEFTSSVASPVTHWGLFDAATAGNLLDYGAFDASQTFGVGSIPRIKAGQLKLKRK